MNKNILITSVGQRVKLVRIFRDTAISLGLDSKVYATDMNPSMAPGGYVSEMCFKVCRCDDPNYVDELLALCEKYEIGIIVPTIDTELLVLAQNKLRFLQKAVYVIVPDAKFVGICRDKRLTDAFMEKIGIPVPRLIDKRHPVFPMFAKPYDGSLSNNIHIIQGKDDLTREILSDPKLMFMEYIDKNEYKEFSVDMYYGRDFHVKSIVPRERLKVRAGEISKGVTRKNEIVKFLKERMEVLSGVVGCLCLQLFFRDCDSKVIGIEINPRFGGGYPLTYFSKANYAENILREYLFNEYLEYSDDWLANTLMLRYDDEVIIYE